MAAGSDNGGETGPGSQEPGLPQEADLYSWITGIVGVVPAGIVSRVRLARSHALELIISLGDLIHARLRNAGIVSDYGTGQFHLMAAIGVRPDLMGVSHSRAFPRGQYGGVR